ncbi:hypothetical protein [Falsiroseomonas stagni]|uniref:Helix-hairpin-helix domain-containing protein n=1 Tax=Falsiroseomonas stagni DSM 19981 TaxID=1123062 RepID=A0A1I4BT92_9PROT|nr:hypothetical protein [Falsiroseomonas stagni]SFK71206.1 hypothetical protein SAMN02745775_10658 [Falsiroseomonas stagni DSM 19981]
MTVEREQAARGLGGRAALEAYRAARVAQRGDLRAALRANREALRAARVLPAGAKTPDSATDTVADAPAPPVLAAPAAPRSVFASLVEAERALAPPEPLPPTVAEVPLPVEDHAAPAAEPMVTDIPAAEAAAAESPIADGPPDGALIVAKPGVIEPKVDEPAIDEPVADEPVIAQPIAAEAIGEDAPTGDDPIGVAAIDVSADAPAAIDLVAAAEVPPDAPPEEPMARATTDLSAIRELGPGMRHRLAQIGYHNCEDLAAADPARLAQQLGEVSRLLRPESWIAAARAAIG